MQILAHVLSATLGLVAVSAPSMLAGYSDLVVRPGPLREVTGTPSSSAAYAPEPASFASQLSGGGECMPRTDPTISAGAEPSAAARPGSKGWDSRYRGRALNLAGSSLVYCERFQRNLTLNGPILWAKQHADVGLAKFDSPGGKAYSFGNGALRLTAYAEAGTYRGGNVQSTHANQAYQGQPVVERSRGFTCAGCFWEARVKFPNAYGTWGAFWLLSPDNPRARGHLEVDVIEYYGIQDRRGHHHTIHSWRNGVNLNMQNDYIGMNEIADFQYHTYGVDLRGIAKLDGKPALVIYFDGREVSRVAPNDLKYFSEPFYYLASLTMNPKDKRWTVPQTMEVDYVMAYRPTGR